MASAATLAGKPAVVTGWDSHVTGHGIHVLQHAIPRSVAAAHQALCGAPLPVVDRTRPWGGRGASCCKVCAAEAA